MLLHPSMPSHFREHDSGPRLRAGRIVAAGVRDGILPGSRGSPSGVSGLTPEARQLPPMMTTKIIWILASCSSRCEARPHNGCSSSPMFQARLEIRVQTPEIQERHLPDIAKNVSRAWPHLCQHQLICGLNRRPGTRNRKTRPAIGSPSLSRSPIPFSSLDPLPTSDCEEYPQRP